MIRLPASSRLPKIAQSARSCQGARRNGLPYHSSAVCRRMRSKKLQAVSACGCENGTSFLGPVQQLLAVLLSRVLGGHPAALFHVLEDDAMALESGLPAGQVLPTFYNHIA